MLPGNGGIPFRTTDLGFCSDIAKRVLAHETDGALKVFSDLLNI